MNPSAGKYLILIGAIILLVGLLIYCFGNKLTWPRLDWPDQLRPGHLPGDIRVEGKNGGGFYFPIVTCIVVSILLNLVIGLIRRFFGS